MDGYEFVSITKSKEIQSVFNAEDAAVSGRIMARIPIGRDAHSVEQRL